MNRVDLSTKPSIAVIGAGMGGLSTAIRLAAAGAQVQVFDSASHPGGKMRTIESDAGPIDAGPTVLTMRHQFDELFELVGETLEDHISIVKEDILARHWWLDGSTLDLYAEHEASIEAVRKFAGDREADAFHRFSMRAAELFFGFQDTILNSPNPTFLKLATKVATSPRLLSAMPHGSLARSLDGTFQDLRLRQLFGRYSTYIGGVPRLSPGVLQLIWHAEASGVWHVKGGLHNLAYALSSLAERLGVTFQMSTPVSQILMDGSKVSGIEAQGRKHCCDAVVFNGDPRALTKGVLGPFDNAVPTSAVSPRSLSARVWAFAAKPSGAELVHHNVFFGRNPDDEFGPIQRGDYPDDPTLYVCAQDRGTGAISPEIERFEIIENAAPAESENLEEKTICQKRVFSRLEEFGLTFSPKPETTALTVPAEFNQMFPASLGSLYGRSPHGLMAAFQRPGARTRIPGLYLAGGGAHPGAGIAMATLSGRHAAEAISKDLALPSTCRPTATRGGTSMASPKMVIKQSRSSPL